MLGAAKGGCSQSRSSIKTGFPVGSHREDGVLSVLLSSSEASWWFHVWRMIRYYLLFWNGSWCCWPAWVACFFPPSSHIGIKKKPALKADALDLSMQNIAMLLFWWLASNLELAYPSEVYCNLSLMLGAPVIDGGLRADTHYHPLHPPDAPVLFSPLLERESGSLKCALTISAVRRH